MKRHVIIALLLASAPVYAQQGGPQPLNDIQLRSLNNACTEDSVGLAVERSKLQQRVEQLTAQVAAMTKAAEEAKKKAEPEKAKP